MPIQTITEPDAEVSRIDAYNRGRTRRSNTKVLNADDRYTVVLLRLHDNVTPADYPALGAAVQAVAGIQEVSLLIDGVTTASVPDGKQLVMHVAAHIRMDDVPEP